MATKMYLRKFSEVKTSKAQYLSSPFFWNFRYLLSVSDVGRAIVGCVHLSSSANVSAASILDTFSTNCNEEKMNMVACQTWTSTYGNKKVLSTPSSLHFLSLECGNPFSCHFSWKEEWWSHLKTKTCLFQTILYRTRRENELFKIIFNSFFQKLSWKYFFPCQ